MHDSGRVPSPFWAFFFLPIKWGGWTGCSWKALPTTAYCGSGTPVSWSLVTILVLHFQQHCLNTSHNYVTYMLCPQTSYPTSMSCNFLSGKWCNNICISFRCQNEHMYLLSLPPKGIFFFKKTYENMRGGKSSHIWESRKQMNKREKTQQEKRIFLSQLRLKFWFIRQNFWSS